MAKFIISSGPQVRRFNNDDINVLIGLGATESQAKEALSICKGEINNAAVYILERKNKEPKEVIETIIVPNIFKKLYNKSNTFDVTFIVGEDKVPIGAHKAIVALYSQAFENMLFPKAKMVAPIKYPIIDDILPEEFFGFLEYCYTGNIPNKELSTYLNLYIFADKYIVLGLKKVLKPYIKKLISGNNALTVYEMTKDPSLRDFHKTAEAYICKNAEKIFKEKNLFIKLAEENIKELLKLKLNINEDIILERIIEYVLNKGTENIKLLRDQEKDMLNLVKLHDLTERGLEIARDSGLFKSKILLGMMFNKKRLKS